MKKTNKKDPNTLEVEEGAGICRLLRGGLSDGQQVGAVAPQDGRHEAQEGLLDLQLQRVQALPTVELAFRHRVLRLHVLTVYLIAWHRRAAG